MLPSISCVLSPAIISSASADLSADSRRGQKAFCFSLDPPRPSPLWGTSKDAGSMTSQHRADRQPSVWRGCWLGFGVNVMIFKRSHEVRGYLNVLFWRRHPLRVRGLFHQTTAHTHPLATACLRNLDFGSGRSAARSTTTPRAGEADAERMAEIQRYSYIEATILDAEESGRPSFKHPPAFVHFFCIFREYLPDHTVD
jgi:hypothetical protein